MCWYVQYSKRLYSLVTFFTAVDCGKLNPPQYGQVDFQSTSFQSRAIYSCFNGFQLIGERTRICQADGQWSGEAPICQSKFKYNSATVKF